MVVEDAAVVVVVTGFEVVVMVGRWAAIVGGGVVMGFPVVPEHAN